MILGLDRCPLRQADLPYSLSALLAAHFLGRRGHQTTRKSLTRAHATSYTNRCALQRTDPLGALLLFRAAAKALHSSRHHGPSPAHSLACGLNSRIAPVRCVRLCASLAACRRSQCRRGLRRRGPQKLRQRYLFSRPTGWPRLRPLYWLPSPACLAQTRLARTKLLRHAHRSSRTDRQRDDGPALHWARG